MAGKPSERDPQFISLIGKGISFDRLERRLRPKLGLDDPIAEVREHDGFGGFSRAGFLGPRERLLEVIRHDWGLVESRGISHGVIAQALEDLTRTHRTAGLLASGFTYQPPLFFSGDQSCPWDCGIGGDNAGLIAKVEITDTPEYMTGLLQRSTEEEDLESALRLFEEIADEVILSENPRGTMREWRGLMFIPLTSLLPHLIKEHFFFEGRESPFRAEPEFLIRALNLSRGRPTGST